MILAVRILMVDDAAHWRKFVNFILRIDPELEIVSDVSTGDEAVKQAADLKPNVVLLDINLPGMSGLEAGRRILSHDPNTKVVFVSQERDVDIVHEALRIGGSAFVVKTDAASQLVTAIHAVTRGQVFLSRSLPPASGTIQ